MKLHELFESEERSVSSAIGSLTPHADGDIMCAHNYLTSLKGCPSRIEKDFYCDNNELTSLEFAPSYVVGDFYAYNNKITSLHNIHKQIKHIGGFLSLENNPIKSHVLGVLLIDGLQNILMYHQSNDRLNDTVAKILRKHLQGDRDIFACQEELIENGFEDFAQL